METKSKSPVPSDSETEKQQASEIEKPIEKYSKIMTSSHPASGLSLLAESAVSSRLPLTADRPNMREQLLAKAVEKKQVNVILLIYINCGELYAKTNAIFTF